MRLFKRLIGLMVLAGFLGLTAAEWSHVHKELGAAPAANCSVCKIAHQTPALTPTVQVFSMDLAAVGLVSEQPASLQLVFASTSHGLSPPAL